MEDAENGVRKDKEDMGERAVPASSDASWNTEERMLAIFGSSTEILSYSLCL